MKSKYVGKRIKGFRKMRNLTLSQLGYLINKSESTISKYESGDIIIDLETLYDISEALKVPIDQLIYVPNAEKEKTEEYTPTFFNDIDILYSYCYDGRSNELIRCIMEVSNYSENNKKKVYFYMNFKDYNMYQDCENKYQGYIEHFHALTNIELVNLDTGMEKSNIKILATFLDTDLRWGLYSGFSFRPMMPVSLKMLFSRNKLEENREFINSLKISKDDIKNLKHYNMFSIT